MDKIISSIVAVIGSVAAGAGAHAAVSSTEAAQIMKAGSFA
jgi:hypothetical protein